MNRSIRVPFPDRSNTAPLISGEHADAREGHVWPVVDCPGKRNHLIERDSEFHSPFAGLRIRVRVGSDIRVYSNPESHRLIPGCVDEHVEFFNRFQVHQSDPMMHRLFQLGP